MSGLDEQYSIECSYCHKIPKYWTLGKSAAGGIIWLYTEGHPMNRAGGIIRISRLARAKRVDIIEPRIDYIWCSTCFKRFKDTWLVKSMINRAKKLEEEGKVVFY